MHMFAGKDGARSSPARPAPARFIFSQKREKQLGTFWGAAAAEPCPGSSPLITEPSSPELLKREGLGKEGLGKEGLALSTWQPWMRFSSFQLTTAICSNSPITAAGLGVVGLAAGAGGEHQLQQQ